MIKCSVRYYLKPDCLSRVVRLCWQDVADDFVRSRIAFFRHRKKAGIGTPQVRCREIHQSGRDCTAPLIRLTPQSGIHFTRSISASAFAELSQPELTSFLWIHPMRAARSPNEHVVNFDEPLIHRAKDDGIFTAPAMRVAVMMIFLMQQCVTETECMQHGFIGVALAMFFQDGFPDHFVGNLLLRWQIVRVCKTSRHRSQANKSADHFGGQDCSRPRP